MDTIIQDYYIMITITSYNTAVFVLRCNCDVLRFPFSDYPFALLNTALSQGRGESAFGVVERGGAYKFGDAKLNGA